MAEESLLKRVMPHSIEAEQSVIGAMIMDRDAVTVASEMLSVEDFYQKQYGILFVYSIVLCRIIRWYSCRNNPGCIR